VTSVTNGALRRGTGALLTGCSDFGCSGAKPMDIEEIRLIADLRIMHAKVDELSQIVANLKRRHSDADILRYADPPVIAENIQSVDNIYLWFVKLKEERERAKRA
jgi:hypothetical protein